MSKVSKKTPIIKKKCSIKKIAEQYDLDAADYEELLKRIKLDIRRHKKIIKSKKSTKKDIEDSRRKLEGLLCSQAVLKERIYEEAGVSTETIGKPKSANEEQKLINFLLSKAVKEPPQEKVKDEAEKKVEKITPLTKADFYKKNTKDQKKDLDEALDKMEQIKKTITEKVIVTPVEKEELKLIKKEIAEVGSVRSSLNDPAVKVVPAIPPKPTITAKSATVTPAPASSTVQYAKKKLKIKDLKDKLEKSVQDKLQKEIELEEKAQNLKNELDDKILELENLNSQIDDVIRKDNEFEQRIIGFLNTEIISDVIKYDTTYSNLDREITDANRVLSQTRDEGEYIKYKTIFKEAVTKLIRLLDKNEEITDPDLKNEIIEIKDITKNMKLTKEKYKKELDKLNNEINKKSLQLQNTIETIKNLSEDKEYLEQQTRVMSEELDQFGISTEKLKADFAEINNKLTENSNEIDRLKDDIKNKEDTITDLEKKLSSTITSGDYRELKIDLNDAKEKVEKLKGMLKQKEKEIEDLTDERDSKIALVAELDKEYEGTLYKYQILGKENESLISKLEKSSEMNDFITKTSEDRYAEIQKLADQISKKNQIIGENHDILASKKQVLNNLQIELEAGRIKEDEYKANITMLEKNIVRYQKRYDDIVKTNASVREVDSALNSLNNMKDLLESTKLQRSTIIDSIKKVKEEIDKIDKDQKKIEKETRRLIEDKVENQVEEQQIASKAVDDIKENIESKKEEIEIVVPTFFKKSEEETQKENIPEIWYGYENPSEDLISDVEESVEALSEGDVSMLENLKKKIVNPIREKLPKKYEQFMPSSVLPKESETTIMMTQKEYDELSDIKKEELRNRIIISKIVYQAPK